MVALNEQGDATRDGEFYLRKSDGSPAVKLGDGDAEDLSPDGKWVLVRRNNAKEIALVPTGTGNAVPLPAGGFERVDGVIFTDDGKSVLMAARGSDGRRAFYLQEIPNGKPRKLFEGAGYAGKALSPDGRRLVTYGADWKDDLTVTPLDGDAATTIPHTNTSIRSAGARTGSLSSPSSSEVSRRGSSASTSRPAAGSSGRSSALRISRASFDIAPIMISADEKSYAYGYSSTMTSDLYVVSGIK